MIKTGEHGPKQNSDPVLPGAEEEQNLKSHHCQSQMPQPRMGSKARF